MKRFILILAPVVLSAASAFGQCCPTIESIQVLPVYPTTLDSIYVITRVTTPDTGNYLGNDVYHDGFDVRIEGCYFWGGEVGTGTQHIDTINIGLKSQGSYELAFEAYQSEHDMICNERLDSTNTAATFSVIFLTITEPTIAGAVQLYPNPVQGGTLYLKPLEPIEMLNYQLYNSLGELVREGTATASGTVDVSDLEGVYYISVHNGSEISRAKLIIP